MKKFIYLIIILIFLIICLFIVREIKLNNSDKIDTSVSMSQNEVINLLKKGSMYNNYYRMRIKENGIKEELFYKDNILTCYLNSKIQYWINFSNENKEMIVFDDITASIVEDFESIEFPNEFSQLGYYISIYDINNFDFKYIGKTFINNRNTIIVKSILKQNTYSTIELKYYIDAYTGVVVKRIDYSKIFGITKQIQVFDRGIQFDTVTNEQIQKPDLNNYDIISTHFPALEIW